MQQFYHNFYSLANKFFDLATFSPERVEGEGSPDTLSFGKNGFTLVLPEAASAPSADNVYVTEDGIECVFVKASDSTYKLYPKVLVDYQIKTSVTLWSNLVYNVYIPKANAEGFTVDGIVPEYREVTIDDVEYYHVAINMPVYESLNDMTLKVALKSGEATVNAKWTLNILNY